MEKYEQVIELCTQGCQVRTIARQLGLHRSKKRKYVNTGEIPEIAQRREMLVKLDPYLGYLEEGWQTGRRNRLQLWREIREQRFDSMHQLVYSWTKQKGYPKKGLSKSPEGDTIETAYQPMKALPWSAKRASWLLVLNQVVLDQENRAAFERMVQAEPMIAVALKLFKNFFTCCGTDYQAYCRIGSGKPRIVG